VHGPAGPADRHLADPGRGVAEVLPVPEGAEEGLLGDVLGGQPASGQRVGQPHHRLVLAQVEGLESPRLGQRVERIDRADVRLHHRAPPRPRHSTLPSSAFTCPEADGRFTRMRYPTTGVGRGVEAGLTAVDLPKLAVRRPSEDSERRRPERCPVRVVLK
jgi:hypothetical protein